MRTTLLIPLLILLSLTSTQAATIDVYTGEAVVTSKEDSERRRAVPLALENVLQKYSGLRSFEDYPQVEPVLATAQSILVSVYYRSVETSHADGSKGEELRLVARFSRNSIDEMARSLFLPLWQTDRDPLDIWIVVDDGLDRRIMPVEFDYARSAMADSADRRGLPINWPVADEEGLYAVDAQLLWGGYTEDLGIEKGEGAMITAVRREGPEWSVRNNLTYNDQNWTWRLQDIDLQSVLTESVQQAIDVIAAAVSIAASDLGTRMHELTVAGLKNADDYRRCLGYLQRLGVVEQVSVVSAQAGVVVFRLELNALPQYLQDAVSGGQFLELDEDSGNYFLQPDRADS